MQKRVHREERTGPTCAFVQPFTVRLGGVAVFKGVSRPSTASAETPTTIFAPVVPESVALSATPLSMPDDSDASIKRDLLKTDTDCKATSHRNGPLEVRPPSASASSLMARLALSSTPHENDAGGGATLAATVFPTESNAHINPAGSGVLLSSSAEIRPASFSAPAEPPKGLLAPPCAKRQRKVGAAASATTTTKATPPLATDQEPACGGATDVALIPTNGYA